MVILRRGVQAPFASFAGGREDGERPHQPEGGRAGRLRGPVQNQETYPAEQADEGLLREAGALRAGAAAAACTWLCACERVHICMHTCVRMCARVCLHMRVRPSVALLSCPRLQVVPTACPSRLTVHPSPGRGARWPPGWGRAGRLLPWRSQRLNLCAAPPPPHGGWATSVGTRPWSQCGFQTVPDPVPRFLSRHWPPTP